MHNSADNGWITVHDSRVLNRSLRALSWWIGAPVVFLLGLTYIASVLPRANSRVPFTTQLIVVGAVVLLLAHASWKTRVQASIQISETGLRWMVRGKQEEMQWSEVKMITPDTDRLQLRSMTGQTVQIEVSAVPDWARVRQLLEEGTRHVGWLPTEVRGLPKN